MIILDNRLELRRAIVASLLTCVYLPSIITFISYRGLLYSIGRASTFFVLAAIFIAELLKSIYLNSDIQGKRNKSGRSRVGDVLKSSVFLFWVMLCFFVGVILFGAPFLDFHEQNLMLSSLLTLLTVFPLIAHTGVETTMQLLFGVKTIPKDTVVEVLVNNAVFAVGGAWLGAVVIPLDWSRPWQEWPIPCYLGAIAGYLLSNVLIVFKISLMSAASKYPVLNLIVKILDNVQVPK